MRAFIWSLLCLAAAGRADWTRIPSPPSDSARDPVSSVVSHGNGLWAMTATGVYRSGDSGQTWRSARPPGFPRSPDIMYASGSLFSAAGCLYATAPTGLFFTCDDGATWKNSVIPDSGLAGNRLLGGVSKIAGDSSLLMAGSSGADWPSNQSSALYLSTDRGLTWRTPPLSLPFAASMQWLSQSGSRLWVGAGQIYESDDGGKTWNGSDAPVEPDLGFVKQMGRLWSLGIYDGFYASADDGKTWELLPVALPGGLSNFAPLTLVSAQGKLFTSGMAQSSPVGVYMSSDTGKTWEARNQGLPVVPNGAGYDVQDVKYVYALGRVLLAQASYGIYRSEDLGAHWQASDTGLSIGVDNFAPDLLYPYGDRVYARAPSATGLTAWYVTSDSARSWQPWRPGIPGLSSLAFSDHTVFAYRANWDSTVTDPIYRSTDGMKTWTPYSGPWSAGNSPRVMGIYASGSHIYVSSEIRSGSWSSHDEGATWTTDPVLAYIEAFRPIAVGNVLLRKEIPSRKVGLSTDSGRTWSQPFPGTSAIGPSAVLDPSHLLLFLGESTYVSGDGGKTWSANPRAMNGLYASGLAVFAGKVFASTSSGLRVSRNGLDWEDIGETGLSTRGPRVISVSGDSLLALVGKRVCYTSDLGSHWSGGFPVPNYSTFWLGWGKNLWAGKKDGFYAAEAGGIAGSTDTGRTWERAFGGGLLGAAGKADGLVVASIQGIWRLPNPYTQSPANFVSDLPGKQRDNCALAMADGGLYLSKAEGGFVLPGSDAGWSAAKFPGTWPHDVLAGDGQRLAVSSAEGIFWRGSAQSDWQPVEDGLPKDEVSALALDGGKLFVALRSKGLWMSKALPVAVSPKAAGFLPITAPVIFATADGSPLFRLRLAQPAVVRLSLHAVTGQSLTSMESALSPGVQDMKPRIRKHGAVFYRLEVMPVDRPGGGRVFRGRIP